MLARRYRPATASEIAAGGSRLLHVTFDDAFRSVADMCPTLEKLGIRATIFACSEYADGGRTFDVPELAAEAAAYPSELATMSWDRLAELSDRGIEIGSHTRSHPHLRELSDAELDAELAESRMRIEDELRRRCRVLAYPYGEHDARVRAAARRSCYTAAFALPGEVGRPDVFAIPRVGIWRHTTLVRTVLKTSPVNDVVGVLRRWR